MICDEQRRVLSLTLLLDCLLAISLGLRQPLLQGRHSFLGAIVDVGFLLGQLAFVFHRLLTGFFDASGATHLLAMAITAELEAFLDSIFATSRAKCFRLLLLLLLLKLLAWLGLGKSRGLMIGGDIDLPALRNNFLAADQLACSGMDGGEGAVHWLHSSVVIEEGAAPKLLLRNELIGFVYMHGEVVVVVVVTGGDGW